MVMRNGFAAAAVMQGIVQFVVAVVVTLMWGWRFLRCSRVQKGVYLKVWFWNLQWGDFVSEVVHLTLLVLVGYSMMEAIGHSDLHSWRPTVVYNAGVIYSYLSLFAVLSSVFRQIAYCWMEPAKVAKFEVLRKQNELTIQGEIWFSLQDISDDWRWQRVFGQLEEAWTRWRGWCWQPLLWRAYGHSESLRLSRSGPSRTSLHKRSLLLQNLQSEECHLMTEARDQSWMGS
jgi:hypothetical protein